MNTRKRFTSVFLVKYTAMYWSQAFPFSIAYEHKARAFITNKIKQRENPPGKTIELSAGLYRREIWITTHQHTSSTGPFDKLPYCYRYRVLDERIIYFCVHTMACSWAKTRIFLLYSKLDFGVWYFRVTFSVTSGKHVHKLRYILDVLCRYRWVLWSRIFHPVVHYLVVMLLLWSSDHPVFGLNF